MTRPTLRSSIGGGNGIGSIFSADRAGAAIALGSIVVLVIIANTFKGARGG